MDLILPLLSSFQKKKNVWHTALVQREVPRSDIDKYSVVFTSGI